MVAFRAPAVELTTPSLTFQRATFYIELNNLASRLYWHCGCCCHHRRLVYPIIFRRVHDQTANGCAASAAPTGCACCQCRTGRRPSPNTGFQGRRFLEIQSRRKTCLGLFKHSYSVSEWNFHSTVHRQGQDAGSGICREQRDASRTGPIWWPYSSFVRSPSNSGLDYNFQHTPTVPFLCRQTVARLV